MKYLRFIITGNIYKVVGESKSIDSISIQQYMIVDPTNSVIGFKSDKVISIPRDLHTSIEFLTDEQVEAYEKEFDYIRLTQ